MSSSEDGMSTKKAKKMVDKKSTKKSGPIADKQFVMRNSVLTDLFDNDPHIRTVHHIFVAISICFGLHTMAHDYFMKNEVHSGFTLIFSGFAKFHMVLRSWVELMLINCLGYAFFVIWAKTRIYYFNREFQKLWDIIWLLTYIGYLIISYKRAEFFVNTFQLPPPSACIILLEQARLSMKLHSFIRTTAVTVYNYKSYTEKNLLLPTFTQYLYFLFAPTCIFRTDYPRTGRIRWKYIFFWFIEILCVIACVSFIFHRYFISAYEDFGIRRFSWKELIVSFLEHLLPAMMVYLSGFYLLFHSFQNIFAELLRFGDRHFYGDWWNCGKFSEYFQTWNVIVHDWLYIYLYKDMYEHVVKNKSVAKLTTFLVSGIVHEWALMNMFGYFFPAVFVFFMAFVMMSIFLKIPNASLVNTLFWLSLPLGCSLLISGYTLEFFARKNTSGSDDSLKNFLLPRWLTCDCIE